MITNNTVIEPTIAGTQDVNEYFPNLEELFIQRENLLETIEDILAEQIKVVFIEGPDGIGKTTLLAQFNKKNNANTISLFYDANRINYYNLNSLYYSLYKQICFILNIDVPEEIDIQDYKQLLYQLMNNKRGKEYYFIVDGLNDLKDDLKDEIIKEIFQWIAIDNFSFKYIITGDYKLYKNLLSPDTNYKSFILSKFSIEETKRYLSNYKINYNGNIENIYKITKGNPCSLTTIKRILEITKNNLSIFSNQDKIEPKDSKELSEIEWSLIEGSLDKDAKQLLSIITYSKENFNIEQLAVISNINKNSIGTYLQKLPFIKINSDDTVQFSNTITKELYKEKLKELEQETRKNILEYIEREEEYHIQKFLPEYYWDSGRTQDMIDYINKDENLLEMVEQDNSLLSFQKRNFIVLDHLKKNNTDFKKNHLLLGFTIQASIIQSFRYSHSISSEVEAFIALEDYNKAIGISFSAVTKEDKFEKLVLLVSKLKAIGKVVEQFLIDSIQSLYKQIDFSVFSEEQVEKISEKLLAVDLKLATDFIEKATNTESGENTRDWIYLKLLAKKELNQEKDKETFDTIYSTIRDPKIKSFFKTNKYIFEDYNPDKIKNEIETLTTTSEKLAVIEPWIIKNKEKEGSIEISKYAFDLVIKTTDYKANAGVFHILSLPLPYSSDELAVKELIQKFDNHRENIKRVGPFEEFFALQLSLILAEKKWIPDKVEERLLDTYLSIGEEKDSIVKLNCHTRAFVFTSKLDGYEDGLNMKKESLEKIQSLYKEVLDSTSDHELIIKPLLSILKNEHFDLAIDWIKRINIQERRDEAYLYLLENYIQLPLHLVEMDRVDFLIQNIKNEEDKELAIIHCIYSFSAWYKSKIANFDLEKIQFMIGKIEGIRDTLDKCRAYTLAYTFIEESLKNSEILNPEELYNKIIALWEAIDDKQTSLEIGYEIVEKIAEVNKDKAYNFMLKINELKKENQFYSKEVIDSYILSIKLIIRLLSGLINKKLYKEEDIISLKSFIDRIPSKIQQAFLWRDITLYFYILNKTDEFQKITKTYTLPYLDNSNSYTRNIIFIILSPCIFLLDKKLFNEKINHCTEQEKERIILLISKFIFTKTLPSEPYKDLDNKKKLNYNEIENLIDLLSLTDRDVLIYRIIESIADATVTNYRKDSGLKREQLNEITSKIESVISKKLPDPNNIQHNGYKIICLAQLYRLQEISDKHKVKDSHWENLFQQTKEIPNKADRVFVFSCLYKITKNKNFKFLNSIIKNAKEIANSIPLIENKINRLLLLSEQMNGKEFEENVKSIQKLIASSDKKTFREFQKELIDMVYQKDSRLATSLASILDDDPANSESLNHRIKKEIINNKIKNKEIQEKLEKKEYKEIEPKFFKKVPGIYWNKLGELNADPSAQQKEKSNKIFSEEILEVINYIPELTLNRLYPIISWFIECINKKSYTEETNKIKEYFDSILPLPNRIYSINQKLCKENKHNNSFLVPKNDIPISIKKFTIQNYHEIYNATVEDLEDYSWIFLTGENGFGKTSVLQAIVIGLYGTVDGRNILAESKNTEITIELNNNEKYTNGKNEKVSQFKKFVTYGSVRLNSQTSSEPKDGSSKTYNLFNTNGYLLDIEDALIKWKNSNDKKYENVRVTLLEVLKPQIEDIIIETYNEKSIVKYFEREHFEEGEVFKKPITFSQLASGVKSTLLMIGDMMIRLFEEQPKILKPSDLEGIVIIDELDLHLHPKWQRELPIQLSKAFPYIQFIVSTHSLIPLLGIPKGKKATFLKVKRDIEEGIIVEKLHIDISNLLPNSILTSPLFDLEKIIPEIYDGKERIFTDPNYYKRDFDKILDDELKKFSFPLE